MAMIIKKRARSPIANANIETTYYACGVGGLYDRGKSTDAVEMTVGDYKIFLSSNELELVFITVKQMRAAE